MSNVSEEILHEYMHAKGLTISTAESCTGGAIANRITDVSGASRVFGHGWVTYANEAKQQHLGLPAELFEKHGAVSEEVARAMAEGALKQSGADHAISVTGIAGPTGGTPEKPVGTVWIGIASANGVTAHRRLNAFDRETFKSVTSQHALELLRLTIMRQG